MTNFMPVDQTKADLLEEKLRNTKLFEGVNHFLGLYNSGMISKKFPLIKELSEDVVSTYKNVKEKSGNLVFISAEEVYIDEILASLKPWELIVKAKRDLSDAVASNKVSEDDIVVLTENGTFAATADEGGTEPFEGEKLFNKNDDIAALLELSSYGTDFDAQYDGYLFRVADVTNVDTGFIHRVKEIIPN